MAAAGDERNLHIGAIIFIFFIIGLLFGFRAEMQDDKQTLPENQNER